MASKVFFMDLKADFKGSLPDKLGRLIGKAGLSDSVKKRDLVAVKLHFGEKGNTAFIKPLFVRKVVKEIKKIGGKPFLTDTNTLYSGTRSDAQSHINTAIENGFACCVTMAPIIIADGLRGRSEIAEIINEKNFKEVFIGQEIQRADAIVSLSHFKGHMLSGFGGTIKNIGMGCASRRGKLAQHSTLCPAIKKKKCIGCGECQSHCSQNAISLKDEKAKIDTNLCIGCGECIVICANGAIEVKWNQSIPVFMENMVEYTKGVLKDKIGKLLFVNFLTDISPECDCLPYNDRPIVRDIGITASMDPVAIDQASVDLVNKEAALLDSCLKTNTAPGEDKIKGVYPKIDWTLQLDYAQKLGLGNREYELEKI